MFKTFIGTYHFDAWDISHALMIAFMRESRSSDNMNAIILKKEICETLHNIQSSFHSAINSFTALEKKHDEIVGTINWVGRKEVCGISL